MVRGMMGWGANISDEQGWRKGPWTPEVDKLLSEYVKLHGEGRWSSVSRCAGLNRTGKSCRLRWVNYLRPGLKRGHITPQEEGIIIELHALWGNKWSTIARFLPGRTDNEIKNYWRTHFKKKEKAPAKQDNKKKIQRQLIRNQPQQAEEAIMMKRDDENVFTSNYYDEELPQVMTSSDTSYVWTENFPMDGLWGGLWNLDDHTGGDKCKMAIQNQPATANCYNYGTDYAVNLYNGGFIF